LAFPVDYSANELLREALRAHGCLLVHRLYGKTGMWIRRNEGEGLLHQFRKCMNMVVDVSFSECAVGWRGSEVLGLNGDDGDYHE
jgi:hypothetical protein